MARAASTIAAVGLLLLTLLTNEGRATSSSSDTFKGVALEIRESTIEGAGLGLFVPSVENGGAVIKAGTLLTPFVMSEEEHEDFLNPEAVAEKKRKEKKEEEDKAVDDDDGPWRPGQPWKGKVPFLLEAGTPSAQFINDGANITLTEVWPAEDGLTEIIEAYGKESARLANTEMRQGGEEGGKGGGSEEERRKKMEEAAAAGGGEWYVVATKDLQPGEEVFIAYGDVYWLQRAMASTPFPMQKLLVYAYLSDYYPQVFVKAHMMFDDFARPYSSADRKAGRPSDQFCETFVRDFLGISPAKLVEMKMDKHLMKGGYYEVLNKLMETVVLTRREDVKAAAAAAAGGVVVDDDSTKDKKSGKKTKTTGGGKATATMKGATAAAGGQQKKEAAAGGLGGGGSLGWMKSGAMFGKKEREMEVKAEQ